MDVSPLAWAVTILGVAAVFAFDILVIGRRPHTVSMREATVSVLAYVVLAALFGVGVWVVSGQQYGAEFFAGYITELSLSVDNLFVFVVIMSAFAVPREHQLKVLQLGIVGALVLRGIFIAVGAVLLGYFTWLFFVFGAFLLWTSWKLASGHGTEGEQPEENKLLKRVERVLPTTTEYHGGRYTVQVAGQRVFTPLAVVIVAVFITDLMFAMDSIPAIFGLTEESYIVFTANAFALMGLRQMFFLLDGLLDRLIYLSLGLAVILGFIGVKLILHAAHEYGAHTPDISTAVSLLVIVVTLVATVVASLAKVRKNPEVLATHDVTGHHHPQGTERRLVSDVLKSTYLAENPISESRLYFIVVWGEIVLGSLILMAGLTQPIVLLTISTVAASVVTFFYTALLIRLNTSYRLPGSVRLRGFRLAMMCIAFLFYGFFATLLLVDQVRTNF